MRRGVRDGDQATAVTQCDRVGRQLGRPAIHAILASRHERVVQRFEFCTAGHIDLLVHVQRDVGIGLAHRRQHAPGVHQGIGTDIGTGIGADIEHVAALQLRVGTDVDLVLQRGLGAGLDHGNVDRPPCRQAGAVVGVGARVGDHVQCTGIAFTRLTAGAQQGAAANVDHAGTLQFGVDLRRATRQHAAASGADRQRIAQRAVVVVVGTQSDGAGRNQLGVLADSDLHVRCGDVGYICTAGVEYARAGAVRAAAVAGVVSRPRLQTAHLQHGILADEQRRAALGIRGSKCRVACQQATGTGLRLGGVFIRAAGAQHDIASKQHCRFADPQIRMGIRSRLGLDHTCGQQTRHTDAGCLRILVAAVGGLDRHVARAAIAGRAALRRGFAMNHDTVLDLGVHRVAAAGRGKCTGTGQIQATGAGKCAGVHLAGIHCCQYVQITPVGQHAVGTYPCPHVGMRCGIGHCRTHRQPRCHRRADRLRRYIGTCAGSDGHVTACTGHLAAVTQPGIGVG
ncbi:hypothetical protein D3C81_489870 [compost metagenome]